MRVEGTANLLMSTMLPSTRADFTGCSDCFFRFESLLHDCFNFNEMVSSYLIEHKSSVIV